MRLQLSRVFALFLLVLVLVLTLGSCMPGDYTPEYLKKNKSAYLEQGKAFFKEHPEYKLVTMDYGYSGSSCYNYVSGRLETKEGNFAYYLFPEDGRFYTGELLEYAESELLAQMSEITGYSPDRFPYIQVSSRIPFRCLPGDKPSEYADNDTDTVLTTFEPVFPVDMTKPELCAKIGQAIREESDELFLAVDFKVASLEEVELDAFADCMGFSIIDVTGIGDGGNIVYEIQFGTDPITEERVIELTKRERYSTKYEVLDSYRHPAE